ncbi:hypothetical protein ACFVWR_02775 [Leifsonia sp. NPDC058292]|uniref:hypothetical protein n=1 Tax=Leifsonia sp. NPDC058292 TaxID=3346428 RepID=UPI0036DB829E
MGSRWARVIRGLLASAAAIFVAALFHVAGGGAAPGPIAIALSLAFATLASIALTARRLSLWRLTASVAISQFLFHLLFALGGGTATFASSDGSAMPNHLHSGAALVMSAAPGAPNVTHADMGILPSDAGMWAAHASAVLVTVVAVTFGERAFWGLLESARLVVRSVAGLLLAAASVVLPVFAPHRTAAVAGAEPSRLRDLGIPLGRLRHRGPPAAIAAF